VLSLTCSQVEIDGWRLKSVNHSHAVSESGSTSASVRILAIVRILALTRILTLTAHLHGSVLPQQIFRRARLVGRAFHPDPIVSVAESRVVADHQGETWNPCGDE